jgi:hypothetical protein
VIRLRRGYGATSLRARLRLGKQGSAVIDRLYRNSVGEIVDGGWGRDMMAACDFGKH